MTHENDEAHDIDCSISQDEADDLSYEARLSAPPEKSTDPDDPNFDAGLATWRHSHIDKFDVDPEDDTDL